MKRTQQLLILDTVLFVSLVVLLEPRSSLAVHEWLGLAVIPLIVIHVLYAWRWIVGTLVRLRERRGGRLGVNFLLNTLLFIAFVVTAFTGVMTSFIALPALGITPGNFEGWRRLHNQWSTLLLIIAALHLALNWGWVVGAVRRHLLNRPTPRGDAAIRAVATEPPEA